MKVYFEYQRAMDRLQKQFETNGGVLFPSEFQEMLKVKNKMLQILNQVPTNQMWKNYAKNKIRELTTILKQKVKPKHEALMFMVTHRLQILQASIQAFETLVF